MAQWGRILTGLQLRKGFAQTMPSTLTEMEKIYGSNFQQLTHSTPSIKGVGLLLSLAQIMLLFMTAYFPSFLSFSASESSS
jgi:hypothetical protein